MEVASTSRENRCEVCSAENIASSHFGVRSCRACAAFFRRSVSENKTFVCRLRGNCIIHKDQKCLCKKCRLVKCFKVGMLVTGVQQKRGKDKVELAQGPSSVPCQPILLQKLLQNYKDLCIIRKATERALFPESYQTMHTSGPLTGYTLCTMGHVAVFGKAHLPSVVEFLANSFEEFSELNEEEKWTLIKPYHIYLQWFDSCYHTFLKLPEHLYTSYSIISATTYWDTNSHEKWFAMDKVPEFMKESLSSYTEDFMKREMKIEKQKTLREISRIKITDEEHAALVGLLFWNSRWPLIREEDRHISVVDNCTDKAHGMIQRARARLYEELGMHYQSTGEPYPEVRLGEILNILNILQVEAHRFRNNLLLFNVFDALDKEDFFFHVMQNIK